MNITGHPEIVSSYFNYCRTILDNTELKDTQECNELKDLYKEYDSRVRNLEQKYGDVVSRLPILVSGYSRILEGFDKCRI